MTVRIINADVLAGLAELPDESVHCVVTSPPYWGLRDYGVDGQIGLEPTPDQFISRMVGVFREVRRVLRKDGTCWLNLGDTYAKDKNMIGVPWRVAFALQDNGWVLRSDIVWNKPNAMPENVSDRPTKAHEYVFLLAKSARYYYDAAAIQEDAVSDHPSGNGFKRDARLTYQNSFGEGRGNSMQWKGVGGPRNKRTVWTIATKPFDEAHFATFPPELPELCIKAGCPVGGTVLDPFSGAGTTCLVADRLQRNGIGIELNPEYAAMSQRRIAADRGGLLDVMEAAQ